MAECRSGNEGSTSMTSFDRVNMRVVAAGVGLCAAALALSPTAAAGGYECVETSAGTAPGAAAAAAPCAPLAAPVNEMAGVPMALPGPVPVVPVAPVPLGAPVPVGAPVPLGAPVPIAPVAAPVPVAAPLPVGAPLVEMAGTGKGDFVGPPAPGAPAPGQPIPPGPTG